MGRGPASADQAVARPPQPRSGRSGPLQPSPQAGSPLGGVRATGGRARRHEPPHALDERPSRNPTPWHRRYLLKLENLLRSVQPALTVPYWDYANDHARPDWGAPGDYRFSGKTGPGRAGPAARPGPLLPIQSFPR
ncbi:tyrosinase family protein [Kitasatospora aureofaciens]|uniref:tyrosinase family protein n=1 Tax=Kitasatospora aureofaciens TaxID=1894 RepID=UPI0033D89CDE